MNNVSLIGRLVRDVEVKYSKEGKSITRFTVAVDRRYKTEGQDDADFIPCIAFNKVGEFIEKYFSKGQRIALTGQIHTGNYTNKDGQKVYTTDVIVATVEFVESKNPTASSGYNADKKPTPNTANSDGFMNIPDNVDDEGLPFN